MDVPGYEVLSELGRGGMGVVWSARDARGRRVAIKTLLSSLKDPTLAGRFEREQRLQSALGEEEGFVPLLATGVAQGVPYLVMPLLTRGTLRDRVKKGPFKVEEAL
ncbi:MAG: protein kinase, partial [Planctomycetota bacterium]